MNAYQIFSKKQHENMKKDNPNEKTNISVLSKIISEKWNKMGDKEKEEYEELYSNDKIRYEQELEEYDNNIYSCTF